jgi:rhodanese-related sulfurtransferase
MRSLKIWLILVWILAAGCQVGSGDAELPDAFDTEAGQDGTTGGDPALGLDAGDDGGLETGDTGRGDEVQDAGTADAGGDSHSADTDNGGDLGSVDAGYDAGLADQDAPACLSGEAPALTSLTPEELYLALDGKDFLLINVASGTGDQIPGTDTFIPHDDTEALVEYIGSDLTTHVVLYCVSSGRSGAAGNDLVDLGYCSIQHLAGGLNAWVGAGYPVE